MFSFSYLDRVEPVSADDVTPSSFVANKCFVEIIPDTTFQLYNRLGTLAYSLANRRGVHCRNFTY